jgi:glutamate/aspartate transport system permease protein
MQEFSFQVFEAYTGATVMNFLDAKRVLGVLDKRFRTMGLPFSLLINIVVVTAMRIIEQRVAIPGYIAGK